MRQNRLSVRARTTVGQKLPDDWEEKVVNFREFVLRRREELGIQADRVFNMDEVPMSFDAPHSRTVDSTGAESVPVSTTGHEKTGFTVVLACQWSSLNAKQCQKKSSQMVWLSTATAKDGWIAAEWLFGARKCGDQDLCLSSTEHRF